MQVKTRQDQPSFQPVTLKITFNTREEFQVIRDMLSWNKSIPELIYKGDVRSQRVLTSVMQGILDHIVDVQ